MASSQPSSSTPPSQASSQSKGRPSMHPLWDIPPEAPAYVTDIHDFIHAYTTSDTVQIQGTSFEALKAAWLKRNFSLIHDGCPTDQHLSQREYVQRLFAHCLVYFEESRPMLFKMTALYTLYLLYETQHLLNKIRIYVTPSQLRDIVSTLTKVPAAVDAIKIFRILWAKSAFVLGAVTMPHDRRAHTNGFIMDERADEKQKYIHTSLRDVKISLPMQLELERHESNMITLRQALASIGDHDLDHIPTVYLGQGEGDQKAAREEPNLMHGPSLQRCREWLEAQSAKIDELRMLKVSKRVTRVMDSEMITSSGIDRMARGIIDADRTRKARGRGTKKPFGSKQPAIVKEQIPTLNFREEASSAQPASLHTVRSDVDADDADIVEMADELEYELLEDDGDQPLGPLPPGPSSSAAVPKAEMIEPALEREVKQEHPLPSPPNAAEMAAPKKRARTRVQSEKSKASASTSGTGGAPAPNSAADKKQEAPPEKSGNSIANVINMTPPYPPPWRLGPDDAAADEPQLEKKTERGSRKQATSTSANKAQPKKRKK